MMPIAAAIMVIILLIEIPCDFNDVCQWAQCGPVRGKHAPKACGMQDLFMQFL
jgi:hypothetical protein